MRTVLAGAGGPGRISRSVEQLLLTVMGCASIQTRPRGQVSKRARQRLQYRLLLTCLRLRRKEFFGTNQDISGQSRKCTPTWRLPGSLALLHDAKCHFIAPTGDLRSVISTRC